MEDSFVLSRKGLIRKKESGHLDDSLNSNANVSISLGNTEIRKLLEEEKERDRHIRDVKQYIGRIFEGMDTDKSESGIPSTRAKSEQLYTQFLEVLHGRTNDAELFETIQDLIQTCTDTLDDMLLQSKRAIDRVGVSEEIKNLQMERNVWRLIYSLYRDRVIVQKEAMDCDDIPLGGSEKTIVEHLYASNSNLREYQLIVDWLELCALEQSSVQVGHYTDHTVAWENSLHQLQNAHSDNATAFRSKRDMVESLDPDAPIREKKPLHDFDMEDQQRLMRDVFLKIRQGRIEEAQSLCEHCGQPWQAAILEGWRLHHDPNYEVLGGSTEKAQIEGNPRRDAWKKFAWRMADSRLADEYTRAIVGVFSGHLESLLSLPEPTWMDLIWSYLKVQIDIRVESEIRDCSLKSYIAMPEAYWKAKMSLEQIFENISAHRSERIRRESEGFINTVVKFVILDNVPELMVEIGEWLQRPGGQKQLSGQMLRFLAHLVLFMRQIGRSHREDVADRVVRTYVEWLFAINDPRLVAFYTATLPGDTQVLLYAKFQNQITDTEERRRCLDEAMKAGLDVATIATSTVRQTLQRDEEDTVKISALEWLTFYPQHRAELLWQGNSLIRALIAARRVESVRGAIESIPNDSLDVLVQQFGSKEDIPWREECAMKEYLCHQTYLAAIDGFNAWTHLYHSRPKEPQEARVSNFTERVAQQEKEKVFNAELQQWKEALEEQTRETRDLLYNILVFPDQGWLVDPECLDSVEIRDKEDWSLRAVQMDALRRLCLPEIVLLLLKVLHLSGEYRECIRLVDELASEQHQIYQMFSQHKLAEVLTKVAESSLALMNDKCDPWGYSTA